MRIETPKDAKVVRAKMPYGKLLGQLEKPKAALKRATIEDMPPLTEATRQATVERERKDGKLRGVQSGESYEQALERFAREDGKPYAQPIDEGQDEEPLDIDMYLNSPHYRDEVLEGRDPSSIEEPTEKIELPMIDLEGEHSQAALEKDIQDIYKHEAPKETGAAVAPIDESAIKTRGQNFMKGFNKQAEKNAKDAPAPQQTAAETTNMMRSVAGASVAPQEAGGMNALQEQAKRYLMKR